MAKTNFNHNRPAVTYVVSSNYSKYTSQPESGSTNEQVFYSLFLPVQSPTAITPVTFFILKPKSLWLSNIGGTIKDIHSNSGTKIVSYSPSYNSGDAITINFLQYPLNLTTFLTSRGLSGFSLPQEMSNTTVILGEDANDANRARVAAPNLIGDTSYESFSRWL